MPLFSDRFIDQKIAHDLLTEIGTFDYAAQQLVRVAQQIVQRVPSVATAHQWDLAVNRISQKMSPIQKQRPWAYHRDAVDSIGDRTEIQGEVRMFINDCLDRAHGLLALELSLFQSLQKHLPPKILNRTAPDLHTTIRLLANCYFTLLQHLHPQIPPYGSVLWGDLYCYGTIKGLKPFSRFRQYFDPAISRFNHHRNRDLHITPIESTDSILVYSYLEREDEVRARMYLKEILEFLRELRDATLAMHADSHVADKGFVTWTFGLATGHYEVDLLRDCSPSPGSKSSQNMTYNWAAKLMKDSEDYARYLRRSQKDDNLGNSTNKGTPGVIVAVCETTAKLLQGLRLEPKDVKFSNQTLEAPKTLKLIEIT